MLRSRAASVALVLTVVVVGMAAYRTAGAEKAIDAGTVNGEAIYPFDVTDARQIVGDADNVFTGRVIEQVGTQELIKSGAGVPAPRTLFSVEVQDNVKGNLDGTVVVSQDGGRVEYAADRDYPEAGVEQGDLVTQLVLIEGDPLLKPGQPYLFSTRQSQEPGHHHITAAGYANERINDAPERERLTEVYEKAKARQIDPLELDPSELPVDDGVE